MRRRQRTCIIAFLAVLLGISFAGAAGRIDLAVDCDRGQSLHAALRRAARFELTRVRVRGTCIGSFTVTGEFPVEIVGDPNGTAVLRSPGGNALSALDAGWLQVSDVRLEGGTGLYAAGNRRVVGLLRSELAADFFGVRSEAGALVGIQEGDVVGGYAGVWSDHGSVVVERTRVHGGVFGVSASHSTLWLDRAEIEDNSAGVLADNRSDIQVIGGGFSENGYFHLGATEDSRLSLYNPKIGGPGDSTALSLYAHQSGAIELASDDPEAVVWGSASFFDDSFFTLIGATLHGSIALRSFSRLRLDGTVADGVVDCQEAADTWCGPGAAALTIGCASAPPTCVPSGPSSTPDRLPLSGQPHRPKIFTSDPAGIGSDPPDLQRRD